MSDGNTTPAPSQYPTVEQIDQAYTNNCAKLGALDYEFRALNDRLSSLQDRLVEVESEKQTIEKVIAQLQATKVHVTSEEFQAALEAEKQAMQKVGGPESQTIEAEVGVETQEDGDHGDEG